MGEAHRQFGMQVPGLFRGSRRHGEFRLVPVPGQIEEIGRKDGGLKESSPLRMVDTTNRRRVGLFFTLLNKPFSSITSDSPASRHYYGQFNYIFSWRPIFSWPGRPRGAHHYLGPPLAAGPFGNPGLAVAALGKPELFFRRRQLGDGRPLQFEALFNQRPQIGPLSSCSPSWRR